MSSRSKRSKSKRTQLRETHFPGSSAYIWPQPAEEGWGWVPRNLCLVLAAIDELKDKGLDVTRAYLDLFMLNLGEGIAEIHDERDLAKRAGLTANDRGVRSWGERLKVLENLGFIKVNRGAGGKVEYVVLVHPRKVMKALRRDGKVSDELWRMFQTSLVDFDPKNTDPNEPMSPSTRAVDGDDASVPAAHSPVQVRSTL
jgi:hypothetical protein